MLYKDYHDNVGGKGRSPNTYLACLFSQQSNSANLKP